jgi:PAS domain S-box-containing protein
VAETGDGEEHVRVLCVAGEGSRDPVESRLQQADGIDLVSVPDAETALATLTDTVFDCVVTAYSLPDGTGADLAERLDERASVLPTVVFAADGGDRAAVEAARADAEDYVPLRTEYGGLDLLVSRTRTLGQAARDRRRLERTNRRLEALVAAAPTSIVELDRDGRVRRWNRGAEETFGWTAAEVLGEINPIIPEHDREAAEDRLERVLDGESIRRQETRRRTKSGEPVDLLLSVVPIEGEPDRVLAVFEDITPQKRAERQLRALQRTARELTTAESVDEIGTVAVEAAADILEFDITGLWRYDERRNALVPVTMTSGGDAVLGRQPTFEPGDSLAWRAFADDETRVYDDLRTVSGRHNPDTPIDSEIIVPLGDRGVIITGSTAPQEFSDRDVDLFRVLGATVEAAMVRTAREAELRRQNERLDAFAGVVSHDLRNPLSVAEGYLDLARESGDPEHFDRVEAAHDRIGQLIDDLLSVARAGTAVEDAMTLDLATVARDAWGHVETDGASLTVADDLPTVHGDGSRLAQLFENLFRNAVEHGSTGSRPEADDSVEHGSTDGHVAVTVGTLDDGGGFYVADDGPGIPEDRREAVFDHGVSYGDGTGFGLSIVADIARAHGWTVSLTENDDGGARFEFEAGTGEE